MGYSSRHCMAKAVCNSESTTTTLLFRNRSRAALTFDWTVSRLSPNENLAVVVEVLNFHVKEYNADMEVSG